ncbi:hypothetical protein ACF1BQ_030620 [Bradyrhizobium sp. RDT10]
MQSLSVGAKTTAHGAHHPDAAAAGRNHPGPRDDLGLESEDMSRHAMVAEAAGDHHTLADPCLLRGG